MSTSTFQTRQISISPERFALGAIAVYVLNFGALALVAVITPFALVLGGLLLRELGLVSVEPATEGIEPGMAVIIGSLTILACLLSVVAVGYFFYWGLKSILRGRAARAVTFLALLVALHVLWALLLGFRTINWFNVALVWFSLVLVAARWRRLFP